MTIASQRTNARIARMIAPRKTPNSGTAPPESDVLPRLSGPPTDCVRHPDRPAAQHAAPGCAGDVSREGANGVGDVSRPRKIARARDRAEPRSCRLRLDAEGKAREGQRERGQQCRTRDSRAKD